MATAREVVQSALRKILSDGEGTSPSAAEMEDGLEALNDFMESLSVDGVRLTHQTLTLDDSVNLDKAHIRGLKAQLAVELAPEFGASIDPQVAFTAKESKKSLRADTRARRTTPVDTAILRGNRWSSGW
jgi:hypothetical protein